MNTYEQEKERNKRMENQMNARQMYAKLNKALPEKMVPGNIGDISAALWPFWFSFNSNELMPGNGMNTSVTITQEAAFILMAINKTVFLRTGAIAPFQYTAINALDSSEAVSNAPDLMFTLRDAQSTRVFLGNPMSVDELGCAEFPTILPTPQLMLPNSTMECIYQNNHASNVYVPFVTLFGYRLRIENAAQILSMITG